MSETIKEKEPAAMGVATSSENKNTCLDNDTTDEPKSQALNAVTAVEELIKRLAELECENARLREDQSKSVHKSDREVFKYVSMNVKKELFGYKENTDTGKINKDFSEPNMNNKFVRMIRPLLITVNPRMETYPSSKKGRYQITPIGFNAYSDEEFKIIKEMILTCVEAVYVAKCKLKKSRAKVGADNG